jgi:ABC-2 type transport system ATP-binding protein
VLLTSHYMKDVQALCRRAIIINEGEIKHDGPLAEIVDRFSTYKVIELLFGGDTRPPDLERFGEVFDDNFPRAKIKVPRNQVPEILAALLSQYALEDVGVHDRPLEEAIAEIFTTTKNAVAEPVAAAGAMH